MGKRKNQAKKQTRKSQARQKQHPAQTPAWPAKKAKSVALAIIVGFTLLAYSNSFQNALTNWDDDQYVNKNPYLRELSADNLRKLFVGPESFYMGNYHPLTMLSLAIDFQLSEHQAVDEDIEYRVSPVVFHITNWLWHIITTILVFFVALHLARHLQLPRAYLIAGLTGLLFGVHTLHVESVAWISERKDVLYSAFFFASLWAYLLYSQRRRWPLLALSLGLFVLSLLAKGQAVSLAVTLVGVDWLYRRQPNTRTILEKVPYFALALLFGLIAVKAQQETGAITKTEEFTLFERFIYASYGLTMYLVKLIIPSNLSAIYPYPYSSGNLPGTLYLYLLTPVALAWLFFRHLRRNRLLAFSIFFFVGNIIFLLQLLPVGNAVMADRYAYIPSFAFYLFLAWAFARILHQRPQWRGALWLAVAGYSLLLTFMTFERNKVWADSLSLWNDVINKQPTATVAYNNRGSLLRNQEKYQQAIADFTVAIQQDPNYKHAIYNRGTALKDWAEEANQPKYYQQAIADFNRALEIDADFAEAYHNRGLCYDKTGRLQQALQDFNKAITLQIDDYKIYINRGVVKGKMGKLQNALNDFNKALAMQPGQADAYSNRGLAYSQMGQYENALQDFNKAIALKPGFTNAHYNRGLTYYRLKQWDNALNDFNRTLSLAPKNASAYYQRALVYYQTGQRSKTCHDLQKAVQLGYAQAQTLFVQLCKN